VTREAFQQAAGASVLHLALHSGISPRGAWLTLAQGELWADELLGRRVRPRTVVLSSCASNATPGDEMWGSLSSAFLAAGSRNVIASLWSVDDATTRAFMAELYRDFHRPSGSLRTQPPAALARAQRAFIHQGLPPSRWAAFLALGDSP
jgi:CHAT domain-containing protein